MATLAETERNYKQEAGNPPEVQQVAATTQFSHIGRFRRQ